MTMPKLLHILLALALLTASLPAWAGGPNDEATAAILFKEAKALAATGDYAHACLKFSEAQRLYPTQGTLLNIGDCMEHLGRYASAFGAFKAAEVMARDRGDTARQEEAARRAEVLSPRLAKLMIVVPPEARVPGFELRRDGELVGEGQWGSAIPVDTGWHKLEATAPAKKPWSTTVRVEIDGSSMSINVPALEAMSVESAAGTAPFWSGQRIAGVVVGGAGLATLGVSAGFTAAMRSKNQSSLPDCLDRPDAVQRNRRLVAQSSVRSVSCRYRDTHRRGRCDRGRDRRVFHGPTATAPRPPKPRGSGPFPRSD